MKKTILSVIVIIVCVVLLFLLNNKAPELILKANVNLSASDRAFIEKRLAENQAKLAELGEKATVLEKVNFNFVISADYRLLGEYGKAKEILEQSMLLEPNNSNSKSTYSSLLSAMGDKKGALSYINQAIELYPLESNYWLWKFDLEKEAGISSSELEKMYKDAIVKTENHINIVAVYAKFLEEQKKYAEAIEKWQEAIKIEPSLKANYQAEIDRLKVL